MKLCAFVPLWPNFATPERSGDTKPLRRTKYKFFNSVNIISGHILDPLKITPVAKNRFKDYMKSIGKLGGQNKVARLGNDRKIAEGLKPFEDLSV